MRQTGTTVTRLEQEVPDDVDGTIFDVVAAGLGDAGRLLARYHDASARVAHGGGDAALRELDRLHHALDAADAWQMQTRVDTVLSHLSLDADAEFASSSGGRKRQTLLARALVRQPDVLLLDEPTNHLDIDAVEWIEEFLIERGVTLLFVTHDRAFLRNVATRIIELDRGRLVDWGADYDDYLARKEAALAAEAREWEAFDRKLAQEEVWIRTGIQARRTRNEGRVRALEALRVERSARRERVGTVKLQAQEAERSGRLVVEARDVSFSYGDRADRPRLLDDDHARRPRWPHRSQRLRQDDAASPPPRRARARQSAPFALGTGLEIAYFDQLREQLDPEQSVFDSIADGADFVDVGGSRRHVHGYLQDFLFPPDRARTPVRALSGGERNRLLLARLFTRKFNLFVLDEPTNDLDIETLDLLEELLLEFTGTLLVVSHDRAFLDNVVASTLVFEGGGRIGEYVGGYTDWVRQRKPAVPAPPPKRVVAPPPSAPVKAKKRKLSFKETAELASLPDRIDALEKEREQLYASLADPAFLRDGAAVTTAKARLAAIEVELGVLVARWEELETIAAEASA